MYLTCTFFSTWSNSILPGSDELCRFYCHYALFYYAFCRSTDEITLFRHCPSRTCLISAYCAHFENVENIKIIKVRAKLILTAETTWFYRKRFHFFDSLTNHSKHSKSGRSFFWPLVLWFIVFDKGDYYRDDIFRFLPFGVVVLLGGEKDNSD